MGDRPELLVDPFARVVETRLESETAFAASARPCETGVTPREKVADLLTKFHTIPMHVTPATGPSAPGQPLFERRRAYVTKGILAVNILWFLAGALLAFRAGVGKEYWQGVGLPAVLQTLLQIGAISAPDLLQGEWWRLWTNCFVHIGLVHLFVNMLMLATLGSVVERLWGSLRFTAIYFGSGLAGSIGAIALHPHTNGNISVLAGASGAVWGILLSIAVWFLRYRKQLPADMAREWSQKLTFTVGFNLLLSFAPGISFEAHLIGGLIGVILTYWLDRNRRPNRYMSTAGLVVLLMILHLGLLGAMRYSPTWNLLRQPLVRAGDVETPIAVPEQTYSERDAILTILAEFDAKLSPSRFNKLIDRVQRTDYVLGKNSPKAISEAEAILEVTTMARAKLEPLRSGFAGRYLAYVTAVEEVAKAVLAWQALPPRSPLDEILAKQTLAIESWAKLKVP